MKISWMGHACFLIETDKGTKIITDPYEPGSYQGAVGYSAVDIDADIVTISHKHPDHSFTKGFKKARIIDKEGVFKVGDVEIKGILSYHDNQKGKARGTNVIFVISADGINIAHFGDLGTTNIDYQELGAVDIALLPIGGVFTIEADEIEQLYKKVNPKICIPMHFKTPKLGFSIATVEEFIRGKKEVEKRKTLEVNPQNINSFKKIVVLDYLR
ncbi:MAG: MBL fold metallo-hydrolase [Candidatus Omnitrophota bacterium]|nr:MBL fold metallo-hydrolase [Candidatus Omnitrophota bacterium]